MQGNIIKTIRYSYYILMSSCYILMGRYYLLINQQLSYMKCYFSH